MVRRSRGALPKGDVPNVKLGSEGRRKMESAQEITIFPTHCSCRSQIRKVKLMRGISLTLSYLEISTFGYKEHISAMSHDWLMLHINFQYISLHAMK